MPQGERRERSLRPFPSSLQEQGEHNQTAVPAEGPEATHARSAAPQCIPKHPRGAQEDQKMGRGDAVEGS